MNAFKNGSTRHAPLVLLTFASGGMTPLAVASANSSGVGEALRMANCLSATLRSLRAAANSKSARDYTGLDRYMEKQVLHPTEEGTPQGGIVSPVLANMALDGLEKRLRETFPKPKTGYNAKVNVVRYADDFLVTGASKELLEKEVKPLVERFMSERGSATGS